MKIIHTADIHLDSALNTHLIGNDKVKRKNELLQAFAKLVDYANTNKITAVLIAGDFFDAKKITIKTKNYVYDYIQKNAHITFFYLCGNHDENLSAFADVTLPSNLVVFNEKVKTVTLNDVTISGIELNKNNYKTFYDTINLPQNTFNIFVLHGQVDAKASEQNYERIDLKQLENKNINYLALGHYHTFFLGKLGKNGVYAYSGCLEGRGFDETGEKGFVVLNIENGSFTHEFVNISSRQLHEVFVDITNQNTYQEQQNAILKAVSEISKNDLVKIVLTGKVNLNQKVDVNYLLSVMQNKFFFVKMENKTKLNINASDFTNDISLKGEFVKQVLNSNLPDELKDQVILTGIGALLGEEVE